MLSVNASLNNSCSLASNVKRAGLLAVEDKYFGHLGRIQGTAVPNSLGFKRSICRIDPFP